MNDTPNVQEETIIPHVTEEDVKVAIAAIHEDFILGNVEAGEVFSFSEAGYLALSKFNLLAALNAYAAHALIVGLDETTLDGFLKERGLARSFSSENASPEDEVEFETALQQWNSYSVEKQSSLSFDVSNGLVTVEEMRQFAELVPNAAELLNGQQMYIIANNLGSTVTSPDGKLQTTIRQFLEAQPMEVRCTKEWLTDIVRMINYIGVQQAERQKIAEGGYIVRPVVGGADKLNFAYSEGAAQSIGLEAFSVAPIDSRTLGVFVDNFVVMMKEDESFDPSVVNDRCGKLPDGTPLRLRAIEADPTAVYAAGYYHELPEGARLIQVMIPDLNNILPDEEGYNAETYPQPLFPLLAPADATIN